MTETIYSTLVIELENLVSRYEAGDYQNKKLLTSLSENLKALSKQVNIKSVEAFKRLHTHLLKLLRSVLKGDDNRERSLRALKWFYKIIPNFSEYDDGKIHCLLRKYLLGLVSLAQQGEREALGKIYDLYYNLLAAHAGRRARTHGFYPDDAEEWVSKLFLKFLNSNMAEFQSGPASKSIDPIGVFLHQNLYWTYLDAEKERSRRYKNQLKHRQYPSSRIEEFTQGYDTEIDIATYKDLIAEYIAQQKDETKIIYKLWFKDGTPTKQISEQLSIPDNTLRSKILRIREEIKALINQYDKQEIA